MVSYYPDVVGAKRQEMTFELILDRQKPLLNQATFDPRTNQFSPAAIEDLGPSGVLRDSVFYLKLKITNLTLLALTMVTNMFL